MASEPRNDNGIAETTFKPFRLAWNLSLSILLIWFVSVAIQITWVRYHHLDGVAHVEALIDEYMEGSASDGFSEQVATHIHWLIFDVTGIKKLMQRPKLNPPDKSKATTIGEGVNRFTWAAFAPDLLVASYATVLFGVRLSIVLLALPICLLVIGVFGIDGLVQREIRRECGGTESAAIYHRAKLFAFSLLPPAAGLIFLCAPVVIHAEWVLLPTVVVSAILIRVQATYYKKHL
ncbi:DUF4400 domain-containing protein [Limnohabitans sp.]|uniref:DUF4400 domain-containing protein n=1 Tax=Limnohabitans sp. TaxID=1907725 RepID=UPI00286F5766|nr:DUF4400 domain-containing protein [Limnohabitans sp.]